MERSPEAIPNPPRVSVGLFCFNQARFLPRALDALAAQTYSPLEVFLVDDGSQDGSAEILKDASTRMFAECVTVLADGENRGLANRMNQVTREATGEWMVWIAADDELLPQGIHLLMTAATDDVDVVFADLVVMDEIGHPKGYCRPGDTWQGIAAARYVTPGNPVKDFPEFNNFVSGGASAIRRSRLREVGGYVEDIRIEDLHMWLALSPESLFRYVPQPVARYRMVAGSQSRREDIALADLGRLIRHYQSAGGGIPTSGLARLVAMRWALSLLRTRGRPATSVRRAAAMAGLPAGSVWRELPRAAFDPIWRSAVARSVLWFKGSIGRRAQGLMFR